MKHYAKYKMSPGEQTEHDIATWMADLAELGTVRAPYIWPGSWPERDLADMASALPGWHHDSAWIYYEAWDPEIPAAVAQFNRRQPVWWAQIIAADSVWRPPVDLIAVLDRGDAQQVILAMWLGLGETQ